MVWLAIEKDGLVLRVVMATREMSEMRDEKIGRASCRERVF